MAGPVNPGHHAIIKFPDEPGSGVISTSRFVYGQVCPEPVERPENPGDTPSSNPKGEVFVARQRADDYG